jgi:hypothetical protein
MWLVKKQQWGFQPSELRFYFRCVKQSAHSKDLFYEKAWISLIATKEFAYDFTERIKHENFILGTSDKEAKPEELKILITSIFEVKELRHAHT